MGIGYYLYNKIFLLIWYINNKYFFEDIKR